ncbi:adenosylmethionine--8-amino-7-oxononanoate transaminase [Desulfomarina sp.]
MSSPENCDKRAEEILAFDRKHLWHPYTSIEKPLPVFLVESADGCRIRLNDGRELIDGMASWWSVIHGYNHPYLNNAIKEQVDSLAHVMFGGLTHEPAVTLAKMLIEHMPQGLNRVFFCDSGSIAVEVAMKMAMQYSFGLGINGKNRFLTIRSGYHGDSFHAMSVCDPVGGMHSIYRGVLPEYYFADTPRCRFSEDWDEGDIESFETLIRNNHQRICAVILEPIVQGAGGMRFYHPQYLRKVRALCDEFEVLMIADEIATGFGRSGELFGCDHAGVTPDIMCLGKALTGGYMSMAAVVAGEHVGRVLSENEPGVFMHGPTFMANPLGCRVAIASLELLFGSDWRAGVKAIESELKKGLAPCRQLETVADVRVLGAIGVVELKKPVDMERIQKRFVEHGIWVRPFGRLVYVMPSYIIKNDELEFLLTNILRVLEIEADS